MEDKIDIKQLRDELYKHGWKTRKRSQQHLKVFRDKDTFLNYYPTSGKLFDRSSCVQIGISHSPSELVRMIKRAHREGLSRSDHETDKIPSNADCIVYTDGSTKVSEDDTKHGSMGYAAVVVTKDTIRIWSEQGTGTNNFAELKAIELGIRRAVGSVVAIVTDSQLARGWCNGTLKSKNASVTKLIQRIKDNEKLFSGVVYVKVKGHTGEIANEMSDRFARFAASGMLYSGVEVSMPEPKRRAKHGNNSINSVPRIPSHPDGKMRRSKVHRVRRGDVMEHGEPLQSQG